MKTLFSLAGMTGGVDHNEQYLLSPLTTENLQETILVAIRGNWSALRNSNGVPPSFLCSVPLRPDDGHDQLQIILYTRISSRLNNDLFLSI
jgi:hypothetical protein